MTNGLVSKLSPNTPVVTDTNMTNGSVSSKKAGSAGLALTVTYENGTKNFRIIGPSNAPIVRYVLSDSAAVALGSVVMIKTNPGDQAALVTEGKDDTPPM